MSAAISPARAKIYGVERVCAVWEQPRSSFYARRLNNKGIGAPGPTAHKRGPKTGLSDVELCGKIQADLVRSPFQGEGYHAARRLQSQYRGASSLPRPRDGSCGQRSRATHGS